MHPKLLGEFNPPDGINKIPDYIINSNLEVHKQFLVQMYSVTSAYYVHKSGSGLGDTVEIRFLSVTKECAMGIQEMWLHLGVPTKLFNVKSKYNSRWAVISSGVWGYQKMREVLIESKDPLIMHKFNKLDKLANTIKVGVDIPSTVRDTVVTVTN